MSDTLTGRCLCGAVTFEATDTPEQFGVCHCDMCRRWTSGPNFAAHVGAITFGGKGEIGVYRSSDWAERGFCKTCGTPLFYRLVESGVHYVSVGIFDDQTRWKMINQIFTDEKPAYYDFANKTKMMTAAEVFEAAKKGEAIE